MIAVADVSLRQLREFKHRINPEERQGAYGLYFIRPISIYLTYAALKAGLTANQVTALQTLVGLAGAVCLAFPSNTIVVAGLVLLQLGFILDNVDGEVARYRGEVSVTGKYLDTIGHEFVIPSMYFALGVGSFFREGTFESIVFGFLAGMASLRLDVINMYHEAVQLLESKFDDAFTYYCEPESGEELKIYRKKNEEGLIRIAYAMFAYPAVMNIISVLLIADLFVLPVVFGGVRPGSVYVLLLLTGTLVPIRRAYTVWRIVRRREVERKYMSLIQAFKRKSQNDSTPQHRPLDPPHPLN